MREPARGVQVRRGYGLGPVLAVPGDHVAFGERTVRVNGATRARLAHMPRAGDLVIGADQWLVWPEIDVSLHGVTEDTAAEAVLKAALPMRDDLVGKPYKHWFFREQNTP